MRLTRLALGTLCFVASGAFAAPFAAPKTVPVKDDSASPGGNGNTVVNLIMGNGNVNVLPNQNAAEVIGNLSQIKPKPSAIVPLLYNTNLSAQNPHLNKDFIQVMDWLQQQEIPFYLGIGLAPVSGGKLNTTEFAQIVTEYAKWSDRIQISAASTIFYPADPQGFVDTMNWLNQSLGFKHIQLNGWPRYSQAPGAGLVKFANPAIDSVFYEVSNVTYTVNTDYLPHYFSLNPNMNVMVNYENPSQQVTLAQMSQADQVAAFKATYNSIQNSPYGSAKGGNNTVHWTMPWSRNYLPQTQGTWSFCLDVLASLSGITLPGLPILGGLGIGL